MVRSSLYSNGQAENAVFLKRKIQPPFIFGTGLKELKSKRTDTYLLPKR